MKTGKKAVWAIVGALAVYLLVGLFFMPRSSKVQQTERKPEAEDTLSYAVSMMIARDMPLAMQELGITHATADYFVKGLCDAFPLEKSPEKVAYAQGLVVGASAMEMLDEANYAIQQSDTSMRVDSKLFLEGLKAVAKGDNGKMTVQEATDYYYKSVFGKASDDFMAVNAERNGIEVLPTGVQVKVESLGAGEVPSVGSAIAYIYKASFINGKSFDSSRGETVEAVVGSLLPGLVDALTTLPAGTRCKIYLPWKRAYGDRGSDKVPPYSALVYDIEIVKIVK